MTLPIWSYWRSAGGGPMPPFYQLCWETIRLHNPDARCLGPGDVIELGGQQCLAAATGLPIAIETDLVRAWLLATFGGVWVDLDTICFAPVRLPPAAHDAPLTCVRNPRGKGWSKRATVASPWAASIGSSAAGRVYAHALNLVRRQAAGHRIPWGTTSAGVLSHAAKRAKDVCWIHPCSWHPIPSGLARSVLLRRARRTQHLHRFMRTMPNCVLCHVSNPIPDKYHDSTRQQILQDTTYAAFLLNVALGRSPAIAPRTTAILDRVPRDRPSTGIEVGVFRALNAAQLLQQRRNLHLVAVDPYGVASKDYAATGDYQTRFTEQRWHKVAEEARRRLRFAGDRVTWIRHASPAAADVVPDRSVDWVFIDGNHGYPAVVADLRAWLPKVKPGGWIGGHDYHHKREGRGYGVTAAVDSWIATTSLTVATGQDFTWFVQL